MKRCFLHLLLRTSCYGLRWRHVSLTSAILGGLVVFLWPILLFCQTSLTVPTDDPAYTYLNDLRAWGLTSADIAGTKPYTRADFARLVLAAKTNLPAVAPKNISPFLLHSLDELAGCFAPEIEIAQGKKQSDVAARLIDRLSFSYANFNGADRTLAYRRLDAVVNPFTAYQEDRLLVPGQNLAMESGHALSLGKWASFYYQGRHVLIDPLNTAVIKRGTYFETLRAYAKFTFGNLNLLIGKDNMVWGPGARGNLILSNNAAPIGEFESLPLVKLSNNKPSRLPWVFRGLGPMRYTIFLSHLEKHRADFVHPWFVGTRLNFRPGAHSEFGISHTLILGGRDFPIRYNFFDALAEYFFIRTKQNLLFNIEIGERVKNGNIANHLGGVDFRIVFPQLRFAEIYGEIAADDVEFKLDKMLTEDLAFHGGLNIPRLIADGRLSLRLEFTRTSSLFYPASRPFEAGYIYHRRILGSDLGPAGQEIYAEAAYRPTLNTILTLFGDWQTRDFDARITADTNARPPEERRLFGGRTTLHLHPRLVLHFDGCLQRTRSFANIPGEDQDAWYVSAGVEMTDVWRLPKRD